MKESLDDMVDKLNGEPRDDHDEKFHAVIILLGQLRKQEHGSSKGLVDKYHASTAANELNYLIQATEGLEPDPLTNDVLQARDHLWEALGYESEDEE